MHDASAKAMDPRGEASPLDGALIDLGKSVSILADQIERLAGRLRPVSSEEERGDSPPLLAAARGSSPAVKRVDEEAHRVARLAEVLDRLCGGLEV